MKKLLATILALVLALGLCSVSWAAGLTTETDGVYHIKSGEELLAFAKMVNDDSKTFEGEKVVLDNDIDISTQEWRPIGERRTGGIKFKGTFDGQNKTITLKITNCTDYGALFEAIEGATVQNVTVAGTVSGASVAGVVGQAGAGSKIINCTNKASVTGSSKAAGVVVKIEGNGVEVIGCKNEGSIGGEAPNGAAGIVTYAESANFIVKNCTNSGNISGKGASGIVYNVNDPGTGVVESCVNTSAVKSTSDSNAAAGIVSVNLKGSGLKIVNCSNTGVIEGENCSAICYNEYNTNDASAPNTNSGKIKATVSRTISESTAVLNGDMSIGLTIHPYAAVTINSGNYSGSIESKGSLTVAGGTFSNGGNFYSSGTLVINNGTFARGVSVQTGTATINDGDFKTDVSCAGDGKLTINGGKFAGEIHADGTSAVNINGGEFTFNTDTNEVIDIKAGAKVTISNGVFAQENTYRFCPNNKDRLTVTGGTFVSDAMVTALMGETNAPQATVVDGQNTMYAVGSAAIASAANSGKKVTVTKGGEITGINANVKITVADGVGDVTVNGKKVSSGEYTVPEEQKPSNNYYYYSPSTTTTDTTKGSPKTFDAGIGVYAVTAVLSLSGMAWTAKKRED